MPLSAGTRLESYEIVSPLGAGGMGEVYRARDLKLNRDVAIKVLPEHLALDPAALSRFEREAQAAAALNHPNIMAIHGFGAAQGVAYAVTELLEGETLREKLGGSALPTRKAVDYALQIVHGIAAAHQKGVIHRDLKPENVFVSEEGRVKILDFGLAKTAAPAGEGSLLQTQSGLPTSPGTVMGTVGYMSPEQVRGRPVDHRTDIFSFGVVFYEMLSGLRAFHGDSHVETMNAILKEDPPDLTTSSSGIPMALDRIVRRCLEKSPAERFHSAHDLGLALETLSGSSGPSAASIAAIAPPSRARWTPWLLAAGAVALAGAAYLAGRKFAGPAAADPPTFHRLTFRSGRISSAQYAGDGKSVVYSAQWGDEPKRLYTATEGSPDSLALAYAGADVVSVSPSGELALVLNRRPLRGHAQIGTLARATLSGGAARAVLEDVQDADWLPDGSGFVASRHADGRYRLEFPVGKVVYESGGYISDVRVSPDGTQVAFVDHAVRGDDRGSIAVIDRAGKKRTLAGDYSSAQGVAWARGGSEIWYTASVRGGARELFAVSLNGAVRSLVRAPGNLHLGDAGADDSALLWDENSRSVIIGRFPGDTTTRDLSWLDWSTVPRLSDDGRTMVFTEQGDAAGVDYAVYVRTIDGGPPVRLGPGVGAAISPDGKWVLNLRLNPAPAQFVLVPIGAGESRVVTHDELAHDAGWFSADGRHITFSAFAPGRPPRLYVQDLSGGTPRPITPEGVTGIPSPDGSLVAFEGKLYAAAETPSPIPGIEAGEAVVGWASDSQAVFVRKLMGSGEQQVFRVDTGTGRRTLLHDIPRLPGAAPGAWFVITPDGSTFAMTCVVGQADLFRVTGLSR
jgi:Tol biopolymer transport system component